MKITADNVRAALADRFPPNEFALFFEVGTGRRADAIAMNLWHSRAYAVHGFEIKVSRSDWLRELKQPAKADATAKFCDYWWIVAPQGVVQEDELPMNWGLLIARPQTKGDVTSVRLRKAVNAMRLEATPLNRYFISVMLRRTAADTREQARQMARTLVDKAKADAEANAVRAAERHDRILADKAAMYDKLVAALGCKDWEAQPEEWRRAVDFVRRCGVTGTYTNIEHALPHLRRAIKDIEEARQRLGKEVIDNAVQV